MHRLRVIDHKLLRLPLFARAGKRSGVLRAAVVAGRADFIEILRFAEKSAAVEQLLPGELAPDEIFGRRIGVKRDHIGRCRDSGVAGRLEPFADIRMRQGVDFRRRIRGADRRGRPPGELCIETGGESGVVPGQQVRFVPDLVIRDLRRTVADDAADIRLPELHLLRIERRHLGRPARHQPRSAVVEDIFELLVVQRKSSQHRIEGGGIEPAALGLLHLPGVLPVQPRPDPADSGRREERKLIAVIPVLLLKNVDAHKRFFVRDLFRRRNPGQPQLRGASVRSQQLRLETAEPAGLRRKLHDPAGQLDRTAGKLSTAVIVAQNQSRAARGRDAADRDELHRFPGFENRTDPAGLELERTVRPGELKRPIAPADPQIEPGEIPSARRRGAETNLRQLGRNLAVLSRLQPEPHRKIRFADQKAGAVRFRRNLLPFRPGTVARELRILKQESDPVGDAGSGRIKPDPARMSELLPDRGFKFPAAALLRQQFDEERLRRAFDFRRNGPPRRQDGQHRPKESGQTFLHLAHEYSC